MTCLITCNAVSVRSPFAGSQRVFLKEPVRLNSQNAYAVSTPFSRAVHAASTYPDNLCLLVGWVIGRGSGMLPLTSYST